PNSADLEAIVKCQTADAARARLLERCALEIKRGAAKSKRKRSANQLPPKVADALVKKMAQVDPQANGQLRLTWTACRHAWAAAFDVVSFLWSEISNWAQRILREVHAIASAYGWREADILEMSAARREFYLEMIGR